MANIRTYKQTFVAGEVSPEMMGRIEDGAYQNGLALCRNFIVRPQGLIENRPGFEFVREARNLGERVRIIPFSYSADQTMVIELGGGYVRFHTMGKTLLRDNGAPYEVLSPYRAEDLFDINFVQSADVMTLVHPKYPPHELRRLSARDWKLVPISFLPALNPPDAPFVAATGHTSVKYTYEYVVTAVHASGSQSSASPKSSAGGNLFETGAKVTISWNSVAGAVRYRVYKYQGGMFGYIGQTSETSLVDDNIAPDLGVTPPVYDDVFATSGSITSVPVLAGGANYGSISGQIKEVTLLDSGDLITYDSNYHLALWMADLDGPGTGATLAITTQEVSMGFAGKHIYLRSITLTNPGHGYKTPCIMWNWNQGLRGRPPFFSAKAFPNSVKLKVTDEGAGLVHLSKRRW